MVATSGYVTQVTTTVLVNRIDGSYAIVSSELPGLYLAGKNLQELMADVPQAIKTLYQLDCGLTVDVHPLSESVDLDNDWAPITPKFVAVEQRAA